jgi:oxygen-independent coproporphyrinogen-3 oxidase
MAGLYIHIPFCKSRCAYCDFHSGIDLQSSAQLIQSLCSEMTSRKSYLGESPIIKTLYLGGGTPSLLIEKELTTILNSAKNTFGLDKCTEMTIEANPDDLTNDYVAMLRRLGFNRISIGIQSFDDEELWLMERRHSTKKAVEAVKICQRNGFNNISIDLMYGLPNQRLASWEKSLECALALNVQHISAYHLTYEHGTKFQQIIDEKIMSPIAEEVSLKMFERLIDKLTENGFEHYEISNFAKEGFRSQHNSSYWNNEPYIGIGPSAHSYDGKSRQWNIAHTQKYIKGISCSEPDAEREELTESEQYNDLIITRLRTREGINLNDLKISTNERYYTYCMQNSERYIISNDLTCQNGYLKLSRKGIFISDTIMTDLIYP